MQQTSTTQGRRGKLINSNEMQQTSTTQGRRGKSICENRGLSNEIQQTSLPTTTYTQMQLWEGIPQ
jgi:hypothetical protein